MTSIEGGDRAIPEYFPSNPPELTKTEQRQLKKEVAQVCTQCFEGMKKLDTFHQHLLLGKSITPEALEVVGSELELLGRWVQEHEQTAAGSSEAQRLIRPEQVRLDQLQQKFDALMSLQNQAAPRALSGTVAEIKSSPELAPIVSKQMGLAKAQARKMAKAGKGQKVKFKAEIASSHMTLPKEIIRQSTRAADRTPFLGLAVHHESAKVGDEVYHTAVDVLRTQKFLDGIDASGNFNDKLPVVEKAVSHLQERLASLETAYARTAARFPNSSFCHTLEEQISLLHSKLVSLMYHEQALRKINPAHTA